MILTSDFTIRRYTSLKLLLLTASQMLLAEGMSATVASLLTRCFSTYWIRANNVRLHI